MQVEGIIIKKTPYKERDLICHILLRSGKTISAYFYGGRGGGKSSKGSIIEIGFMLRMQLQEQRKKTESPILIIKEYSLLWSSDNIRQSYRAFCLLSFYLEFMSRIALKASPRDKFDEGDVGLFRVLSNALFYLDESLKKEVFNLSNQLFFFFAKVIIELGITPNLDYCQFCEIKFSEDDLCLFAPVDGGFSCISCTSKQDEFLSDNPHLRNEYLSSLKLRRSLKHSFGITYKEYETLGVVGPGQTSAQFSYINYQFGFNKDNFKTWNLLTN